MIRLFLFAAALGCAGAQASELTELVSDLRAGSSNCARARGLAPFTARGQLDQAAAAIAGGVPLLEAASAAGYRAAKVQLIRLSGTTERAQLRALLASRFCELLADASLVDAGAYRRGVDSWIVLAAPFGPRVGVGQDEAGRRVLALANKARSTPRRCGSADFAAGGPLVWSEVLARVAREHSEDMARRNYFAHEAPDGSGPAERVARVGYRYRATGENIAAGQTAPEDAVAGWIRSPHHCANLMNPVFSEMGAAFASNSASELGVYWTQVFGARLR